MNDKKKTGRALSRREFVTTTALGVGATGLGLSTRTTRAAPPPERWDAEADVVIVGYGGAGAVAAITAHDKGSKVLIIEKQPETGHTSNTRMSLAVYLCPAAVDDAIAYMQIASRVNPAMPESKDIDDDTIEVWARYMSQNNDYLKSLGAHDFSVFYDRGVNPSWPGNEAMKAYVPVDADGVKGGGIGLYNLLDRHIKFRNIGLMWDAPATRLIQNAAGEVIGILARNQGREIAIKAARAVVLTCGGSSMTRRR